MRKIYFSTGERSGEIHASFVCKKILQKKPDTELHAMGGEILRQAGVNIFKDASDLAVTGFTEIIKSIPVFRKLLKDCAAYILKNNFDTVVLVDFPGFNMRLAKTLKGKNPNLKIFYYISPKFWAWNYRRVQKMRKYLDHVLCILPFEEKLLKNEGIKATYVGNPLLDEIDFENKGDYIKRMIKNIEHKEIIGLFPGSRRSEIERILPNLIKASKIIKNKMKLACFIIGTPHGINKQRLEQISRIKLDNFIVVEGRSHDIMAASDYILAKSGTTTLETALFGTPMLAVYYTSKITAFIGRLLSRVEHYTLPNLLTYDFCEDEEKRYKAVPEIFQEEATPENIASTAIKTLSDNEERYDAKVKLKNIREILGEKGASERAAEIILKGIL